MNATSQAGAATGKFRALHPVLVFCLALAAYWLTMPRTITLEDGGLFQMVCHLGGISHPPGYPLFTMLCNAMVHSPGVVAGNLVSAIFGALAASVLFEVAMLVDSRPSFAYVASLGWAWSATFWSQAIIIEVYTLAALLFAVCWWLVLMYERRRDERYWFALCFAYGLALTDHWPLMILSTPGLVACGWPAVKDLLLRLRSPRFLGLSIAAVVLGLAPYLWLFVNPNPPIAVYGGIHSLKEFVRYIARSAYHDSNPVAGIVDKLRYSLWLLRESLSEFGWFGAPVILLGVVASFRFMRSSLAVALLLTWFGTTLLLLSLLNFEYSPLFKAIFIPYPILAGAAIAMWFALGASAVARFLGRYTVHAEPLVLVTVLALVLFSNFARMDRGGSSLVEDYMRTVLTSLPRGAVLFVRGDNETGPIGYLHYVAGLRPDVEVRDWDNLVFSNRIASAFAPDKVHDEAIRLFVAGSKRRIFVMDGLLSPHIDYGAYFEYTPGGQDGYRFLPSLGAMVDMLVEVYQGQLVTNDHEKYFVYERLIQFARQYVGYAIAHSGEPIPNDVASRVTMLQQTFPGKLVTLQEFVRLGADQRQKQVLLDLASSASKQVPDFATPESIAVFYELYARAELFPPADLDAAEHFFEKSLEAYPSHLNTSICSLKDVYKRRGETSKVQLVESRYPRVECTP